MTPKEKAKELVDKFDEILTYLESKTKAKQCSLIAVEELVKQEVRLNNGRFYPSKYWQEVKQEIEKL